ncbi:MAG: hypothetical protein KAX55_00675 [Propionivibrio sp.]|nr:hypothetical protein [Propionivibrio sp.]
MQVAMQTKNQHSDRNEPPTTAILARIAQREGLDATTMYLKDDTVFFQSSEGLRTVCQVDTSYWQEVRKELVDEALNSRFDVLLRSGQGALLAQTGRLNTLSQSLTKSATAMAVAAMVAIAGVTPNPAHAENLTFERIAKDALGGAAGAGLLGQFGKGRGKQALRVVGAVAGVAVAESLQQPRQPQQVFSFSTSPVPQQVVVPQPTFQQQYPAPTPTGGTEQMLPEKYSRMVEHEQSALTSRDAFARSLYTLQQTAENQVLNPRSKTAMQEYTNANTAAQVAQQQYTTARNDFMKAYEYMASRGYDVRNFAYSYSLLQRQVTEKDMHSRDMAEVEIQQQPYARPTY